MPSLLNHLRKPGLSGKGSTSSGYHHGVSAPSSSDLPSGHVSTSDRRYDEDQTSSWHAIHSASVQLAALISQPPVTVWNVFYRRYHPHEDMHTSRLRLESLMFNKASQILSKDPYAAWSIDQQRRSDRVDRQSLRISRLCSGDEPMSHAGIMQASRVSEDAQLWPLDGDYDTAGLTDVGKLRRDQIDDHTSHWREIQRLAPDLASRVEVEKRLAGTICVGSKVSDIRKDIATRAHKLGFTIPTAKDEDGDRAIVDALAAFSLYTNNNHAQTPESALQFVTTEAPFLSKGTSPLKGYLETLTDRRQTATDLYDACVSFTNEHKLPSNGTRATDADGMLKIRQLASRLEPSSRIPFVNFDSKSSWQNPTEWKSYANYVARLTKGQNLHNGLLRSTISEHTQVGLTRDVTSRTSYQEELDKLPSRLLNEFIGKCDGFDIEGGYRTSE